MPDFRLKIKPVLKETNGLVTQINFAVSVETDTPLANWGDYRVRFWIDHPFATEKGNGLDATGTAYSKVFDCFDGVMPPVVDSELKSVPRRCKSEVICILSGQTTNISIKSSALNAPFEGRQLESYSYPSTKLADWFSPLSWVLERRAARKPLDIYEIRQEYNSPTVTVVLRLSHGIAGDVIAHLAHPLSDEGGFGPLGQRFEGTHLMNGDKISSNRLTFRAMPPKPGVDGMPTLAMEGGRIEFWEAVPYAMEPKQFTIERQDALLCIKPKSGGRFPTGLALGDEITFESENLEGDGFAIVEMDENAIYVLRKGNEYQAIEPENLDMLLFPSRPPSAAFPVEYARLESTGIAIAHRQMSDHRESTKLYEPRYRNNAWSYLPEDDIVSTDEGWTTLWQDFDRRGVCALRYMLSGKDPIKHAETAFTVNPGQAVYTGVQMRKMDSNSWNAFTPYADLAAAELYSIIMPPSQPDLRAGMVTTVPIPDGEPLLFLNEALRSTGGVSLMLSMSGESQPLKMNPPALIAYHEGNSMARPQIAVEGVLLEYVAETQSDLDGGVYIRTRGNPSLDALLDQYGYDAYPFEPGDPIVIALPGFRIEGANISSIVEDEEDFSGVSAMVPVGFRIQGRKGSEESVREALSLHSGTLEFTSPGCCVALCRANAPSTPLRRANPLVATHGSEVRCKLWHRDSAQGSTLAFASSIKCQGQGEIELQAFDADDVPSDRLRPQILTGYKCRGAMNTTIGSEDAIYPLGLNIDGTINLVLGDELHGGTGRRTASTTDKGTFIMPDTQIKTRVLEIRDNVLYLKENPYRNGMDMMFMSRLNAWIDGAAIECPIERIIPGMRYTAAESEYETETPSMKLTGFAVENLNAKECEALGICVLNARTPMYISGNDMFNIVNAPIADYPPMAAPSRLEPSIRNNHGDYVSFWGLCPIEDASSAWEEAIEGNPHLVKVSYPTNSAGYSGVSATDSDAGVTIYRQPVVNLASPTVLIDDVKNGYIYATAYAPRGMSVPGNASRRENDAWQPGIFMCDARNNAIGQIMGVTKAGTQNGVVTFRARLGVDVREAYFGAVATDDRDNTTLIETKSASPVITGISPASTRSGVPVTLTGINLKGSALAGKIGGIDAKGTGMFMQFDGWINDGAHEAMAITPDGVASNILSVTIDNTPPRISLLGAAVQYISRGEPYDRLPFEVADNITPQKQISTKVTENVNTTVTGIYYAEYAATDGVGNQSRAVRTIIVGGGCGLRLRGRPNGGVFADRLTAKPGELVILQAIEGYFNEVTQSNMVYVGDQMATILSGDEDELMFAIPPNAKSGFVTVLTNLEACGVSDPLPFTATHPNEENKIAEPSADMVQGHPTYYIDMGYANATPITDGNVLVQAMATLLLTRRGERLFDPVYGSILHQYVFRAIPMNHDSYEDEIISYIAKLVHDNIPQITIGRENSHLVIDETLSTVDVILDTILPRGNNQLVTFQVSRGG
jgi:phage baseplate assembly protein W